MPSKLHADEAGCKMNGIERIQDLGSLTLGMTTDSRRKTVNSKKSRDIGMTILTAIISPGHVCFRDAAEAIANEHPFTRGTPRRLRQFAIGLRQLADAVDEQAVLVAEALAEIECAEPTVEEVLDHNRALLRGDSVDIEGTTMTRGFILQDYSKQDGYTTWLAFPETARTWPKMNHQEVTLAFEEQLGQAPEVVRRLLGHWRAGPIETKESNTNELLKMP